MKKLLFCRKCLCAALNRIPLVDKCLLVFFLVLLTQSAYSLFSHNGTGSEIEHIDVIVRTSSAAIFGYILSANFILQAEGKSRQTRSGQNPRITETNTFLHRASPPTIPQRMQAPVFNWKKNWSKPETPKMTIQNPSRQNF